MEICFQLLLGTLLDDFLLKLTPCSRWTVYSSGPAAAGVPAVSHLLGGGHRSGEGSEWIHTHSGRLPQRVTGHLLLRYVL